MDIFRMTMPGPSLGVRRFPAKEAGVLTGRFRLVASDLMLAEDAPLYKNRTVMQSLQADFSALA
jgi:hypothetical protein